MALIKCKMCGGQLNIEPDSSVCECEYCGSKQTIPNTDDEKRLKLYERANRLRFDCEFDKASGVYESIVSEYQEEAEAYWGLVLCKYGIEYVDDPASGKKIPTCHRSSFDSVMDDPDFEMVMENADVVARSVYREEAKRIEEIRKGILEVSSTEEPYDIFICYKETADNGDRTIDSVIAQDVYKELTAEGYRVFFSRITLEDKLGQEYEPYIFAALNSAKVMLAFGTSYDYYNAVWVKNEWSRFLKLIAEGQKKTLIPCYKDIDAYDMPKEFKHLQAQDMGKVGAVQDLIRGIEKLIGKKNAVNPAQPISGGDVYTSNVLDAKNAAQLKRGFIALEDGEWENANTFFEEVLNYNAECAEAYLGKFLAREKSASLQEYKDYLVEKINNTIGRMKQNENSLDEIAACEDDGDRVDRIIKNYSVEKVEGLTEDDIRQQLTYERTFTSPLSAISAYRDRFLKGIEEDKYLLRTKQYGNENLTSEVDEIREDLSKVFEDIISEETTIRNEKEKQIVTRYQEHLKSVEESARKRYEEWNADRSRKYEELKAKAEAIINDEEPYVSTVVYSTIHELSKLDGFSDSKEIVNQLGKERQYRDAISAFESGSENSIKDALNTFEILSNYKESAGYVQKCRDNLADFEEDREKARNEEQKRREAEQKAVKKKRRRKRIIVVTALVLVIIGVVYYLYSKNLREKKYNKACDAVDKQRFEEAADLYDELGDYEDSEIMSQYLTAYNDDNYFEALKIYQENEEKINVTAKTNMEGRCIKRICENIDNLIVEKKYDQAVTQYDELMGMVNLKLYIYDTFRIDKAIDFCEAYKELTSINDGEEHNIAHIYDALEVYGYDTSNNKIFDYVFSLNGEWLFVKQIDHKTNKEWIPDNETQKNSGLRVQNAKWEYIDKHYTGYEIKYKSGKYYFHYFGVDDYVEIQAYTVNGDTLQVHHFDKNYGDSEYHIDKTQYYQRIH